MSVVIALALALALDGCPAPQTAGVDRICTPGAYVYCRCEDRSEGTKLCADKGTSFEKCSCGSSAASSGLTPPGTTPTFQRVDAGPPPSNGPTIDAKCAGKLAVVASTEDEDPADPQAPLWVYAGAYGPDHQWTVARSLGPALRGPPRGGIVGSTLVAVWLSRFSLVAWTKFDANQTTLAPPVSVGDISTDKSPAFVGGTATGRIYSVAQDDTLKEGVYASAAGWDDGNALVPPGDVPVAGKGSPAVAIVGSSYVIAYPGGDKSLAVQTQTSGSWGSPQAITGAKVFPSSAPAIAGLVEAADDLLLVWVGDDLVLHWSSRAATAGTWGDQAVVDTAAIPDGDPALATMGKGRAMLVWKAVNGVVTHSVYDASKTPRWSPPAALLGPGPNTSKAPTVSPGRCASEATATYLTEDGKVSLAMYSGGKWTGPFVVPGLAKMTWAGAGEAP